MSTTYLSDSDKYIQLEIHKVNIMGNTLARVGHVAIRVESIQPNLSSHIGLLGPFQPYSST